MLSVELHTHSSLSHDGRDPIELLLEQAQSVGLDALAVTDHDELTASLRAAELAPDYGLVGIPGMEISSAAGHVLALGIAEAVPPGLPFAETLDRIRDQGGLAVVPHPFQESRHGVLDEISKDELATADAIEVYNSRLFTGRSNRQAERFAAENVPDESTVQGASEASGSGKRPGFDERAPDQSGLCTADGSRGRHSRNCWMRLVMRRFTPPAACRKLIRHGVRSPSTVVRP